VSFELPVSDITHRSCSNPDQCPSTRRNFQRIAALGPLMRRTRHPMPPPPPSSQRRREERSVSVAGKARRGGNRNGMPHPLVQHLLRRGETTLSEAFYFGLSISEPIISRSTRVGGQRAPAGTASPLLKLRSRTWLPAFETGLSTSSFVASTGYPSIRKFLSAFYAQRWLSCQSRTSKSATALLDSMGRAFGVRTTTAHFLEKMQVELHKAMVKLMEPSLLDDNVRKESESKNPRGDHFQCLMGHHRPYHDVRAGSITRILFELTTNYCLDDYSCKMA
jgi:hypothetical protein